VRALFDDERYPTRTGASLLSVDRIDLPTASSGANKRDVWLRITKAGGSNDVLFEAYTTRAGAWAATATLLLASATETIALDGTVAMTDNAATSPDMTGLSIEVTDLGLLTASVVEVVHGYTSAPDLVLCDDIEAVLNEYTGAGQAFEGWDTWNFKTAQTHRSDPVKSVAVFTAERVANLSTGTATLPGAAYSIRVEAVMANAYHDSTQDADPAATLFRRLRIIQTALESILLDERREAYGMNVAFRLQAEEMPRFIDDHPDLMACSFDMLAEVTEVWRDDVRV